MDQFRLDFKLNFTFFKNQNKNNYIYFYKYYIHPSIYVNYLDLDADYINEYWFNPYLLKRLVEVDNNEFIFNVSFITKKMKCKKILLKKKYFVNLLYF